MSIRNLYEEGSRLLASSNSEMFFTHQQQGLQRYDCGGDINLYSLVFDRLVFEYSKQSNKDNIYENIMSLAYSDLKRYGETPWGLLARGVAEFSIGHIGNADVYFMLSAAKDIGERFHIAMGVYSRRPRSFPLDEYGDVSARTDFNPTYKFLIRHKQCDDDIVHVLSCDSGYLHKYANAAIESSRKAGVKLIHLHIVNPTSEDLVYAKSFVSKSAVNISYEENPLANVLSPGRERKAYFICPRFIIAPMLLDMYKGPLFITDIDMAITKEWGSIKESLNGVDLGLRRVNGNYPWRRVAAGTVYYSQSRVARTYAEVVARYIKTVFDVTFHKRNWLIDQNALYWAICKLQEERSEVVVANLLDKKFHCVQAAQYFSGGKKGFIDAYDA